MDGSSVYSDSYPNLFITQQCLLACSPLEQEAFVTDMSFKFRAQSSYNAQKNDKDWTVQKRLLSARRASQMAVFDNEIERWGEVDVPYLPSQLIGRETDPLLSLILSVLMGHWPVRGSYQTE
ncbi:hypothetical protein J6590_075898 [Homalodisca vitripennis]|nr:hypothetical protein J6590_075898 [Homalodisca vitripennis]